MHYIHLLIAARIYEAVLLWFYAVNRTLAQGQQPDDGMNVISNILNFTFDSGVSGNVTINHFGDRKLDYSVVMFQPSDVPNKIQVGGSGTGIFCFSI